MRVRPATLDDVRGIVEVYTSGEKLKGSIAELYSRGGPWMSVEALAIHLNNFLLDNQLVAVAEVDGRIIGEVEVLFSEEPVGGRMMGIAHVDVVEVHPGYRRRGVGRALIEFVETVAHERGTRLLTVQPDEGATGFYKRLGFDVDVFSGDVAWIPTVGCGRTRAGAFSWNDVGDLELIAGHFQSSYSMWFSTFRDSVTGVHYTIEAGRSGDSYYALRNLPGREEAVLLIWGRLKDVEPVLGRAKTLGFDRVRTVLPSGMEGLEIRKIGKIGMVGKRLR